jgi:hypothetical protein
MRYIIIFLLSLFVNFAYGQTLNLFAPKRISLTDANSVEIKSNASLIRVKNELGVVYCGFLEPNDSFFYSCNGRKLFSVTDRMQKLAGMGCCQNNSRITTIFKSGSGLDSLNNNYITGVLSEVKKDSLNQFYKIILQFKVPESAQPVNASYELKISKEEFEEKLNKKLIIGEDYKIKVKQ